MSEDHSVSEGGTVVVVVVVVVVFNVPWNGLIDCAAGCSRLAVRTGTSRKQKAAEGRSVKVEAV